MNPPKLRFYTLPSAIQLPPIDLNDFTNFIESTLSNCKLVEWTRENYSYEVEFYPIEGLRIDTTTKLYRMKQMVIFDATNKALDKFPHLLENNDEESEYENEHYLYPQPRLYGGYSKFKIKLYQLYHDDKEKCYVFELQKIKGETLSTYFIYNHIKYELKKNLMWMQRKPYLSLFEGLQIESGREDHICKYLFNELIGKELCSYLNEDYTNYKSQNLI